MSQVAATLTGMEFTGFTTALAREAANMAKAADGRLDARVPTCPEWTMTDLVHHVATVYAHKSAFLRLGHEPQDWPPPAEGDPIARMREALGELLTDFAGRRPGDPTATWYGPDQTVGFWMRRMAHETQIHRVDAELAAGLPVGTVDDDMAEDGIDEVLSFVSWGSQNFPDMWQEEGKPLLGVTFAVDTPGRRRTITVEPDQISVGTTATADPTVVSGDPNTVYRWLWRRVDTDEVTVDGDREQVDRLFGLLGAFGG